MYLTLTLAFERLASASPTECIPSKGKSSFLNAIFGGMRAIVSDIPGTTRDSIDAVMERPPPPGSDELSTIYRFVDTAGIRRKGKIQFGPEFFMVNRALRAIRRADVGKGWRRRKAALQSSLSIHSLT